METRIVESELILPALLLLEKSEEGRMTTTGMIKRLRLLLKPSGEDLEILDGRQDDKFSQKVRNLVSHHTLEKEDFASHAKGTFKINEKGRKYLHEKFDIVSYLVTNDFNWHDLKTSLEKIEKNRRKKVEIFDENIIINEGFKKSVEVTFYNRSKKLRDSAILYYKHKGKIFCSCCKFNFEKFYGLEIGKGFIEIHHIKPVFKFEDEDLEQSIAMAIKNVIPVCSNCHRMIHRNWKSPLDIEFLKGAIRNNGHFIVKH